MKAVHHIVASSAETIGAFNTGFDTVNVNRLTSWSAAAGPDPATDRPPADPLAEPVAEPPAEPAPASLV